VVERIIFLIHSAPAQLCLFSHSIAAVDFDFATLLLAAGLLIHYVAALRMKALRFRNEVSILTVAGS
jgi:hypothetical protein